MHSTLDLLRHIRLGEDSTLEFKRVVVGGGEVRGPHRDRVADSLAAFANTKGGTFVLGVDDKTHDILGIPVEHLDLVERWLRQICVDSIKPALDADIRKIEVPDPSAPIATSASGPVVGGSTDGSGVGVAADGPGEAAASDRERAPEARVALIRVDVERSLFVHRSPGGYVRRLGAATREMAPDVLARLFQERSQTRVIRFDESPIPGTSMSDVDPALAGRFLRDAESVSDVSLRKLRVIVEEDGVDRVTVAGALLCTREPERWLGHARIQAVSYAGERADVNYQNDARDFGGPLDRQVIDALDFVRRNMRIGATKRLGRAERPQFSERAVFEALVNAVAHRDYSMSGAQVRLHMFNDRLELYVPGALANTLTVESMSLRQYSRNELVVSMLTRCPVPAGRDLGRTFLMDRRGDGVPVIIKESRLLAGRDPEYAMIDGSELRLVIWAAAAPEDPAANGE